MAPKKLLFASNCLLDAVALDDDNGFSCNSIMTKL